MSTHQWIFLVFVVSAIGVSIMEYYRWHGVCAKWHWWKEFFYNLLDLLFFVPFFVCFVGLMFGDWK